METTAASNADTSTTRACVHCVASRSGPGAQQRRDQQDAEQHRQPVEQPRVRGVRERSVAVAGGDRARQRACTATAADRACRAPRRRRRPAARRRRLLRRPLRACAARLAGPYVSVTTSSTQSSRARARRRSGSPARPGTAAPRLRRARPSADARTPLRLAPRAPGTPSRAGRHRRSAACSSSPQKPSIEPPGVTANVCSVGKTVDRGKRGHGCDELAARAGPAHRGRASPPASATAARPRGSRRRSGGR